MKRKDCFAFIKLVNKEEKCGALINLDCANCSFYQHKDEVDDETAKLIKKEKVRIEKKEAKNE